MDKQLEELIKIYTRTFKENFPIFSLPSTSESTIMEILQKCLEENVPYKPEYKKGTVQ